LWYNVYVVKATTKGKIMKNSNDFRQELSKITYDTLRSITNIEDKIAISTMLLIARDKKELIYADMLYNNLSLDDAINQINNSQEFKDYQINIKISNNYENTISAFNETIKKLREMEEKDEESDKCYFKYLAERDSMAIAVMEICQIVQKKYKA
jgi:hypothetical protein